ncbi:hypothetical protein D3C81_1933620 [compost metagenome]
MSKWTKLLQALNQTFNSQTSAASTVKPVHRAFDAETKEQVIVLQYRFKSEISNSTDLQKLLVDRSISKLERPKRLLNAITDALLAGGKWPR